MGSTPTVVESNWDVADHDYTKGSHANYSSPSLTPAEDDLITQLTKAMDQVPAVSVKSASPEGVTISINDTKQDAGEIATPDILKELLDFNWFEKEMPQMTNSTSVALNTNNTVKGLVQPTSERSVSPISKEQILDFLQDKMLSPSHSSTAGSESGYESVNSPRSLGSPEMVGVTSPLESPEMMDHAMDIDDSFNELFPSLF